MKNYSVSLDPELIEGKKAGNDDFSLSGYLQGLVARDCATDSGESKENEKSDNVGDIPVYECDELVARVQYTNNLDYWDGSNWTSGSTGRHLGLTVLRSGQYALIHGSNWQGEKNCAEIVDPETALKAICDSDNTDLLDEPRFQHLKKLYNSKQGELEPDEVPPAPPEKP